MITFKSLCVLITLNGQPIGCAPGPIQYFNADSPRYMRSGWLVVRNPRVRYLFPVLEIDGVVVDVVFREGFE